LTIEKIPSETFYFFLTHIDEVIAIINDKLPLPDDLPDLYWSQYNDPDPICLNCQRTFRIPDHIYLILGEKYPQLEDYLSRICINEEDQRFNRAMYSEETDTVTLYGSTKIKTFHNALYFAFYLGFAIAFLDSLEAGIPPKERSMYLLEKKQVTILHDFIDYFPRRTQYACYGDMLRFFIPALFEYDIYTKPNQDFSKAYARAYNRCFYKCHQSTNPFYVIQSAFITNPLRSLTLAIVQAEILSKRSNLY
jgi:hypothetical protein